MTVLTWHHGTRTAVVGVLVALAVACGSPDKAPPPEGAPTATGSAVPREFAAACGHPGTTVTVDAADLPITIAHAACDLRGVTIRTSSGSDVVPGGDVLPETTCDGATGCPSVSVNLTTQDVTIS